MRGFPLSEGRIIVVKSKLTGQICLVLVFSEAL